MQIVREKLEYIVSFVLDGLIFSGSVKWTPKTLLKLMDQANMDRMMLSAWYNMKYCIYNAY
jgi:hypothetical protein